MVARPFSGHRILVGIVLLLVLFNTIGLSSPIASASPRHHPSFATIRAIQTGVVRQINAVRHRFGLSAGRPTIAYQSVVENAARSNNDPIAKVEPGTVEEYGVWEAVPAGAVSSRVVPRVVVYNWVYDDGWKSVSSLNIDCTAPTARGCNSHRRAILSNPPTTGAHLYIDVDVTSSRWHGTPGLSVATLLIWRTSLK